MSKTGKFSRYSPLILRTAIAIVFLWFGFSQLKNPAQWARMLPSYALSLGMSVNSLIYLHGIFEIVFAILLLLGFYTRFASLLLGLNLLHIVFIVGYGPIGARDLALAIATFSIFLRGADKFCLDWIRKEKIEKSEGTESLENNGPD